MLTCKANVSLRPYVLSTPLSICFAALLSLLGNKLTGSIPTEIGMIGPLRKLNRIAQFIASLLLYMEYSQILNSSIAFVAMCYWSCDVDDSCRKLVPGPEQVNCHCSIGNWKTIKLE